MIQDLIVILIGVVVIGYIGWKVYKTISRKQGPVDKCDGCKGCTLKVDFNCNEKK